MGLRRSWKESLLNVDEKIEGGLGYWIGHRLYLFIKLLKLEREDALEDAPHLLLAWKDERNHTELALNSP